MAVDALGRPLRDLRISVTDRCNFRCTYCMPKEVFGRDFAFLDRAELLTHQHSQHLEQSRDVPQRYVRLEVLGAHFVVTRALVVVAHRRRAAGRTDARWIGTRRSAFGTRRYCVVCCYCFDHGTSWWISGLVDAWTRNGKKGDGG